MIGFTRQIQDRIFQANNAGYEITNIDKQIKCQTQRIAIAAQEVTNQQKIIDNSNDVLEFLKNKYTNAELYGWMEGSLRTLNYQIYTLAYQLAKKAQTAYCFERGIDPSEANFISFGYWNPTRDGLQAGESLYLGLKQLEAAYYEKRGHDYEITKHVSLRQLNPLALFELREKSSCDIALPEILFDMDFPGHYQRRIKSVSLSIPCVVGPYTGISGTLRLIDSEYRFNPIATDSNSYPRAADADSTRFRKNTVPISAIAVSGAQNDPGTFELNFRDERYIPFEGAGAISKWRLELPSKFKQWDYTTITDVIMHVRYTSKEGGGALAAVASTAVDDFIKGVADVSQGPGLFAIFDLRSEFATEWARASSPPVDGAAKKVLMKSLVDRLPAYTKGRDVTKVRAQDVFLLLSITGWATGGSLITSDGDDKPFGGEVKDGGIRTLRALGVDTPVDEWVIKLTGNGSGSLGRAWVVARYTLT